MKFSLRINGIILLFVGALTLIAFQFLQFRGPSYAKIHPLFVADLANDSVLVGASHNIFVAKVIRELGQKDLGIGPETQYEVQIIENVKGNLQGTITIDQQGGVKDGVIYVVEDGLVTDQEKGDTYLLQTGSTYLFATRYNKEQNWYTLNSFPTARKLLSADHAASTEQLKAIAQSDIRFKQLQEAYPNEILLEADLKNNNTLNSYASAHQATNNTSQ